MRFYETLEGRVRLPIEPVRDRFRYEPVLTVLPVRGGRDGDREILLVATDAMLAVVTPIPFPRGSWMTQWASWHVVDVEPATSLDERAATVTVGAREFTLHLEGGPGRQALSDFMAVVDSRRAMSTERSPA